MRKIVGILAMAALIVSCGGNRHQMSPEELAQKLDSIKALEIKEKLKLQGIDLESSDNPFKVFFDSLNMQTLPLTYSEDYVRFLPGYQEIPTEILSYMELQGGEHPKAVSHHQSQPHQEESNSRHLRKPTVTKEGSRDQNREWEVGRNTRYDDIDDERHLKR